MDKDQDAFHNLLGVLLLQVHFPQDGFLPEQKLLQLAKLLPSPTETQPMDVDGLEEVSNERGGGGGGRLSGGHPFKKVIIFSVMWEDGVLSGGGGDPFKEIIIHYFVVLYRWI